MPLLPRRWRIALAISSLSCLAFITSLNTYQIKNALSYALRPLWDKPDGPTNLLTHYYSSGLDIDQKLCEMHNWEERHDIPEVWDAVILSSELDLLEIRMNELDSVVDKFFIVESDKTFTGLPKPLYFSDNKTRFAQFEHKIVYAAFPGREPAPNESPFDVEADHRTFMTRLLRSHVRSSVPALVPLVVFSDIDEIPSSHTLLLLRKCSFPSPIHLQLRNYLYSFEWPISANSWRAQVHEWNGGSYYRHSQASDNILADSGWHCSYCFRYLDEFVAKMKGFSHVDRIGGDLTLLNHERIQKVICEGRDIFNMLPEAYSYADLLAMFYPKSTHSAVGLPLYLLHNPDKFKFLLPGGCERER